MSTFDRYAPFVQDFIYENGWESLRSVQVACAEAIFDTDDNVLLSASTASGKTEAAFFPILTEFYEDPPHSVGCIYIGPLKALINDQFLRLYALCEEAHIPVWKWHGDVSQSHKQKMLKHPSGILQITPESLEAMLLHRHAAIHMLFCDLRYVVIDEIHSLLRGDRGNQTICCIERLSKMAGVNPRRIGLSATIGNLQDAGNYLSAGTGRGCVIPKLKGPKDTWRISMAHFFNSGLQAPYRGVDGFGGVYDTCDNAHNAHSARDTHEVFTGETGEYSKAREARVSYLQEAKSETIAQQNSQLNPSTNSPASSITSSTSGITSDSLALLTKNLPAAHTIAQNVNANTGVNGTENTVQNISETTGENTSQHNQHNQHSQQNEPVQPNDEAPTDQAPIFADPGMAYIFEHTKGRKCLVFANSREEAESVCTTLRQYCEAQNEPDRFLIHHGNLSASLRESAEDLMRDDELNITTITTSTLELGIDIGKLERAFQIDAPFTVSSFLQRMGRTGRRNLPPEMWFVMREDEPESRALLPETLPWKLLQGCALIQLYVEDRWIEPPKLDGMPFSLLYHQTMSVLASAGEMSPKALAKNVLTLTPFWRITQDDYKILLRHLIKIDHIEQTDEGGLVVGLAGERIVNNFKFYAVFEENEEFTVRSESEQLGTIVMPPPVGERIAIAGATWVIEAIDYKRHLIECSRVKGKVPAFFGIVAGDINTKILERMKQVLIEDKIYPYLKTNAKARLSQGRIVAQNAHITQKPLVCVGGNSWCLFPWLGTYAFLALERFIKIICADELGLKGMDSSRPYFLQFTMHADEKTFFEVLKKHAEEKIDPMQLVYPGEVPYFDKYDEFVPAELIQKGFAYGVLDVEGMLSRVRSW